MGKETNSNSKDLKKRKSTQEKKGSVREFFESLVFAVVVALVIRALVIYPFRIPTGSMEDTLLIGDFLLANKFVYGIRSPDWIGIPTTRVGFSIPFFRTPGFRKPKKGDVVIFKYPQDSQLNYIKRCVGVSGDTILIRDKVLYINGEKFPNPPESKFINYQTAPEDFIQPEIFPPGAGNIDFYGPVRVPAKGDTFHFTQSNKDEWFERFQLMVYEGNKLEISYKGESIALTVDNQNRWQRAIQVYPPESFLVNGTPVNQVVYEVENRHYFMMGDNRDNSLDSRYWGFLPERYVVGEGLIIYFSWNKDVPLYRIFKKIRWGRILKLIR
ncbi:MAG: signal peptidase I [bacterium]